LNSVSKITLPLDVEHPFFGGNPVRGSQNLSTTANPIRTIRESMRR